MRVFLRILSTFLLVLWMGCIFFLSNQPAEVSSQTSGSVIEAIAEKIYPNFEELDEPEREEVVSSFQFVVRKGAHLAGFAFLGVLAFLTFISYTKLHFFTRVSVAVIISLLYAAGDEWHQYYVPGRSCELRDFLIDSTGVLLATLLCVLFVKIIPSWRRKTAFAGQDKRTLQRMNSTLCDRLDDTVSENKKLEEKIELYKSQMESLERKIVSDSALIFEMQKEAERMEKESKMEEQKLKLSDEMEYAAAVIGEAVVQVTKVCNRLTADEQDETRKELVNLALGRNEVLKSQILRILSAELTFEQKKEQIEAEKRDAYDYFDSIIAQMC